MHIMGGAIIAFLVMVVAGCCSFFCFKKKLSANSWFYAKQKGKLNAKEMKIREFDLEEIERATNKFSEGCLVGSGAFSNVYHGTLDEEGPILAFKKAHDEACITSEEFRNEVRLLSKVKHNNLVGLVGFCEHRTGKKAAKILVYEYMPNGSLHDYIIGRGGKSLTWKQRVNIAIGAAKGIAHLHDRSIIHRDIKPSNILIGEGLEAKVSDFGLVRSGPVGDESHVSSMVKGTPGYLDPAYCSTLHLTPFTDVFSFGVILLQLLAARPVFGSTRTNATSHIIDWAKPSIEKGSIEEILDANLLMEGCDKDVMLKMGQLALKCVVEVPKKRPNMTQIWQELEATFHPPQYSLQIKHPLPIDGLNSNTITRHPSMTDYEFSQSIVSIDGIGLQRFHVDMDNLSFQSASLRCLETSIAMDGDLSKA